MAIDPTQDVRPRIVGDFNFGGIDYIVVYWPERDYLSPEGEVIDMQPSGFQVYRPGPFSEWIKDAVDVRERAYDTRRVLA